ncbi:hypothetical protein CPC08DRAFT_769044 [Agrocybe pediades]|nr:hypothetical protein CPC08DRAFT_769044 [Agrocybe pediades]
MTKQTKEHQNKGKKKATIEAEREDSRVHVPSVPDGYIVGELEGGQMAILPKYMLKGLKDHYACHKAVVENFTDRVEIGIGIPEDREDHESSPDTLVQLLFPPNPIVSQFDLLQRHSEIMAMRDEHGISYKDACHRLYLAELERVKVMQETHHSFKTLEKSIIEALREVASAAPNPVNQEDEHDRGAACSTQTTQ